MSKDPIRFGGAQANLYAYVGNDPMNRRDPTGRVAVVDDVAIAGGAAILVAGAAIYGILAGNPEAVSDTISAIKNGLNSAANKIGEICKIGGEGAELDRIAKDQGIARDALRKALETIKKAAGLRGNENVDILPDGTVVDPVSGDPIGNIHDEQGQ